MIALAKSLGSSGKTDSAHGSDLRHLSLNDCNIANSIDVLGMSFLCMYLLLIKTASGVKLSHLESLSIQFNKIGSEHIQSLTSMMYPRTSGPDQRKFGLDLGFNFIDLHAFSNCLTICKNVTKLSLRRNELEPSDFREFCLALVPFLRFE